MKDRPILFSGPMVRAILDGRKTQTRRVVTPQPEFNDNGCWYPVRPYGKGYQHSLHYAFEDHFRKGAPEDWCPYGQPGGRLWVREAWQAIHVHVDPETGYGDDISVAWDIPVHPGNYWRPVYAADPCHEEDRDDRGFPWRPSIHMPRWASRITLEITGVRVERLNEISEADSKAEGIHKPLGSQFWHTDPSANILPGETPQWAFRNLWESINGPGSWDANPWVWAVEFRRLP